MSDKCIEKWSTLKEVQEYLGVGRETILQWIAKRNMPAYKVGRLWKFKLSEVDEWIREKCTTVGDCEGLKKKIIRLNKLLIENVCRKCNWLDGNECAKIRCDIKEELEAR